MTYISQHQNGEWTAYTERTTTLRLSDCTCKTCLKWKCEAHGYGECRALGPVVGQRNYFPPVPPNQPVHPDKKPDMMSGYLIHHPSPTPDSLSKVGIGHRMTYPHIESNTG